MGSRTLGELLLRPPPLRALVPSSRPAWQRAPACLCPAQRSFTTSAARSEQQQPPPKSGPKAKKAGASNVDTTQAINNLFFGVNAQATSADQLGVAASAAQRTRQFGKDFARTNRPSLSVEDMHLPEPLAPMSQPAPTPKITDKDISYPRLNASTGRTVELDPTRGRDIVRGLGMLGSLMSRNQVKKDFQKQRFHERPGLKRKRLNSERWRARFKQGFTATCKRVTELTRKGW